MKGNPMARKPHSGTPWAKHDVRGTLRGLREDGTMMKRMLISLTAMAGLALVSSALAWDKGPGDATDAIYDQKSVHTRYPGDKAYSFGTVHVRGRKKIPYVERCQWTYQRGIFGLPRGFKFTCRRYTLENTPER